MASIFDNIPHLQNKVLTKVVNMERPNIAPLAGTRIMPDTDVVSRITEWDRTYGARLIAPIVAPTTATPLVKGPGADRLQAEAVDMRVKYAIEEKDVLFLMDPGQRESVSGRSQWANIEKHTLRLKGQVVARCESLVWDALTLGRTLYDATVDGERLSMRVNYGVPAANITTATASWNSPGTMSPKADFAKAQGLVRPKTGRSLKEAWMNTVTYAKLDAASGLQVTYLNRESAPRDLIQNEFTTTIINNIRIVPYDEGHFGLATDADADTHGAGTQTFFIPDDRIVFMVTSTGSDTDGEEFADFAVAPSYLADESVVQGLFGEKFTTFDPTRTYIRVGKVGIPRIYHPDWFVSMDVTP